MRALHIPTGSRAATQAAGGPVTGTRAALPRAVLTGGVVPARSGRRAAAHALDAALVLAALAFGVVAVRVAGGSTAAAWATGTALAVASAAAVLRALVGIGSTPGHHVLGLRTVARDTAMPEGLRGLAPGRVLTADTRLGRDPLRIVPAHAAAMADDGGHWRARSGAGRGTVRLVADDGTSFQVSGATVVGRSPVAPAGTHHDVLAVPDLSRTISKSHVLLEPGPACLWVTDLGSTNGTAVAAPGARFEVLAHGVRTAVPFGARVALGDRVLQVGGETGAQ